MVLGSNFFAKKSNWKPHNALKLQRDHKLQNNICNDHLGDT